MRALCGYNESISLRVGSSHLSKKSVKDLELSEFLFIFASDINIVIMVVAKNYKNKEEVIADFKKAFARKKKWLEEAEKELLKMPSRRKPSVV